ncbi:fibroblast growth factor receptor 2-like [Mercenaria mercenaria]|uniref:fibroblast growth factor receptor 2-like n=1 Tax=Mercenaria mercenaria TaxID=6596 RepID=UPI00234F9CD6|nr:fibroblast growth factor receptor 2-like [Mercenaria mercenaria]
MCRTNSLFYMCIHIFIASVKWTDGFRNCNAMYSRRGIRLRNATNGWIEEYSRCFNDAPKFDKVDAMYVSVSLYDLIKHIPGNRSQDLRFLYLRHGNVSVVRCNSFQKFINISKISLENNRIQVVEENAFLNLSKLHSIDLSDNDIEEIGTSVFCNLPKLETVFLYNNRLHYIAGDAFVSVGSESLNFKLSLQNNSLATLHEDMLPLITRSLESVHGDTLRGNAWRCDCSLYWMITLVQSYNVTGNLVCNEPKHIQMLQFDLEDLVCEKKQTQIGPKLAIVGIILACIVVVIGACVVLVVWLCRKKAGRKTKRFKVSENRHYYRPQSVTDISGLSVSPGSPHVNSYNQESKLDVGFTELALYGKVRLVKLLGRGAFGEVYEGFEGGFNNTGRKVAIKRIKDNASAEEVESLVKECKSLKTVGSHQNIIEVYGSCVINGSRAIVMELAEDGDLRKYLREHYEANRTVIQNLDSSEEKSYLLSQCSRLYIFMWQIAKGMEYLNSLKILHRDLAARNILLSKGPIAKISDFGLSRDIYESDYYFQELGGRLPYKWMSPESLINGKYTTKSDVWSYGILLWEMVTLGSSPYPGILPDMLISMHNSGYIMPQPSLCPSDIYSIMVECWKYTPDERPIFKKLVLDLDDVIQTETKQPYITLSKE